MTLYHPGQGCVCSGSRFWPNHNGIWWGGAPALYILCGTPSTQPASSNLGSSHFAASLSTRRARRTHACFKPRIMMNSTTDTVGWAAEPQGRGTLGLLISCGATVFLCTYSAVHHNLPTLNELPWKILRRKVWYMICCIGAPEWFALLALLERSEVRELRERVCTARYTKIYAQLIQIHRTHSKSQNRGNPGP
jgi:hypothetical protein